MRGRAVAVSGAALFLQTDNPEDNFTVRRVRMSCKSPSSLVRVLRQARFELNADCLPARFLDGSFNDRHLDRQAQLPRSPSVTSSK
jgi:hypothetical protein